MRNKQIIKIKCLYFFSSDGGKTVITTTHIVTKGGHKLPDFEHLEQLQQQQQQQYVEEKLMEQILSHDRRDMPITNISAASTTSTKTKPPNENGDNDNDNQHLHDFETKPPVVFGNLTREELSTTGTAGGFTQQVEKTVDDAFGQIKADFIQQATDANTKPIVEQFISHEKHQ